MSNYYAMFEKQGDQTLYYWPKPYATYEKASAKCRKLKLSGARITFVLHPDEGKVVRDYFANAVVADLEGL